MAFLVAVLLVLTATEMDFGAQIFSKRRHKCCFFHLELCYFLCVKVPALLTLKLEHRTGTGRIRRVKQQCSKSQCSHRTIYSAFLVVEVM